MRVLSHQWRDKKPFTRRARWYCQSYEQRDSNIRLVFEDETGNVNRFYGDEAEAAKADFAAFKAGGATVATLRRKEAKQ